MRPLNPMAIISAAIWMEKSPLIFCLNSGASSRKKMSKTLLFRFSKNTARISQQSEGKNNNFRISPLSPSLSPFSFSRSLYSGIF